MRIRFQYDSKAVFVEATEIAAIKPNGFDDRNTTIVLKSGDKITVEGDSEDVARTITIRECIDEID